jgi:hypothetical protein
VLAASSCLNCSGALLTPFCNGCLKENNLTIIVGSWWLQGWAKLARYMAAETLDYEFD